LPSLADREAGDPLEAFIDDVPRRFDHAAPVLFASYRRSTSTIAPRAAAELMT